MIWVSATLRIIAMIGACIPKTKGKTTPNHHWRANNTVSGQTIRLRRDNGSTSETTTVTAAWSGHVSKLRSWYVMMGHVLMKQAWPSLKNSTLCSLCCNYSDFNKRHEDAWSTVVPPLPLTFHLSLIAHIPTPRNGGPCEVPGRFSSSMASSFSFSSLASPLPQWSPAGVAVPLKHANFLQVASTRETTPFILMGNCLNSGPAPETINRDSQTRLQTPNPVKVEHFPNRPWQYLNMNIRRHAHRASYRLPR